MSPNSPIIDIIENYMLKAKSFLLLVCFLIIPTVVFSTEAIPTNSSLEQKQAHVQAMLDQFVRKIDKDPSLYTITVEDSEVLNAYATIGRRIVVFTGLIDSLNNDSALAFVVAHELGHIELRHSINGMLRTGFFALLKSFFGFKPNIVRVYDGLTYLGELHYSRGSEEEADLFSVNLMNQLYCKTPGKLEFFESNLEKEQNQTKISEYFSTHPLDSTRLMYLRESITAAGCVA